LIDPSDDAGLLDHVHTIDETRHTV
jgi:hypothetical protein